MEIKTAQQLEAANAVDFDEEIKVGCFHATRKAFIAAWSELLAMAFFIYVGTGSISTSGTDASGAVIEVPPMQVAFTFGLAYAVAVYMTAHRSGGHVNPAVTIALVLSGDCAFTDGILIILGQAVGAICGAVLVACSVYESENRDLGTNQLRDGSDEFNAYIAEAFCTFMLLVVIYETGIHNKSVTRTSRNTRPIVAPLVLGLTVFCCHTVLIPIDGCSMNPFRSLAPALIAMFRKVEGDDKYWKHMHIFLISPCVGAVAAAIYSRVIRTSGYFTSGSSQDSGMRRRSVFDTNDLAKAQPDIEIQDVDGPDTEIQNVDGDDLEAENLSE